VSGGDELLLLALPRSTASATPEARTRLLRSLAGVARERLLLATCERVELYLVGASVRARLPEARHEEAAARHLLRVAAGLESRLVGEPQILGQLRAAFLEAQAERALGPVLGALARGALHAGRRARAETGLGRAPSLVALTLAHLAEQLEGLRRRSVLVAGTGALGAEIAHALRAAGVGRLLVSSHSAARAAALAARCGAFACALPHSPPVDAVVACSARPLDLGRVRARRAAPLAVVDLGVPPNLDAAAAARDDVRIIRLGQLTRGAIAGVAPAALRAAERILDEELARFRRWRAARLRHAPARNPTMLWAEDAAPAVFAR
jgi:glutamyl-tRNA reductase